MYTLKCQHCGNIFSSRFKDVKLCNDCKNRPCEVCGKPFEHPWPYTQKCCSKACTSIWKRDPERNKEWVAKREATTLARYGVKNVVELDEVRKKISASRNAEEYKEKVRKTSLEKYGVDHYQSSPEVREKMIATRQQNYNSNPHRLDKVRDSIMEELKLSTFSKEFQNMTQNEFSEYCHQLKTKFAEFLKFEYNVSVTFKVYISDSSEQHVYDLGVLNSDILLNFNPSFTHSDLPTHWGPGKDKNHHLNQMKFAEEHNHRCIQIFDWDNLDKIAKMLIQKETIYARNCKIGLVKQSDANEFLDEYHLQGKTRGATYACGLYLEDKLVSVMTFGKPRYNKNYQWELLRLCTLPEYQIIGGASKMFKKFMQDVDPVSVISYCDKAKFRGDVYYQLGFTLRYETNPAKVWSKGNKNITDNLLRQRGYDQLFRTNFGKGSSNAELMIKNGWRSVYDCGQMVFEWSR